MLMNPQALVTIRKIVFATLLLVLRVIVYGLLIFFGFSAVISTLVAFLAGWDTPPYPGEYIELAIFYDFLFLAMIGMTLVAWRRWKQTHAHAVTPSSAQRFGISWRQLAGLLSLFSLAILLVAILLALCPADLLAPGAFRMLHGLTGTCGILAVFGLLLTALHWLPRFNSQN